ncbi:uncharacterized protein LACBIDRAFT_300793 [Laccaria bicolor S238N-H82]|uniref:Predicted protein n=1 Tax=Laccaria bicolor (strain S238N-H82 / ATCC MYA-4686) TaxID=486041 RepID=B0CQJ8_LACBS|nr:uncharacterized protein LACBIDRAFT_300793 [Laccaria bicolor S238N-H82]EDR15047.1 predicted protein [Laccaria bicolor S238N-H82]|eukprot:XP_001873255.1 predicted protein [Laccaria bicolor S238N-H82]
MCHVVQTVTTHAVFAVQVVQRPCCCQQPGNIRTMRHDENTMPQHDNNTERAHVPTNNTSDSAAHEQQPAHPRMTSTAGERALHPQTNDEHPGHDDPRPRMQTTAHKRRRLPTNVSGHGPSNLSKRAQRAGVKGHVEDSHNERVGMQAPRPKNPPCIIPHNVDFHQRTSPRRPTLPMLSKSWGEVAIPLIFRSSQGCTAVSIDTRTALARFIGHLWRRTLPQVGVPLGFYKSATHTCKNPHPWTRVQVLTGMGTTLGIPRS